MSASNFGKLIIIPFPFMVGMSYDDCEEMDYFTSYEQIKQLVEINNRPEIMEKKKIRFALRALNGVQINYNLRIRESRS